MDVDRTNAALLGLTQQDVATNLLISLSGSQQTAPTFWVDPKTGIAIQRHDPGAAVPTDLAAGPGGHAAHRGHRRQRSSCWPTWRRSDRGVGQGVVSHYNARPVIDIYGSVDGTDLGTVGDAVHAQVDAARHELPRGSDLMVRGQIETMRTSFNGLAYGMIGAVLLIYLLIVVNFQSWLDPLIIITRAAGGAGRHGLDAVRHAYHHQRAGADRRHHVHGRGHGQQHPGGQLRARAHGRGPVSAAAAALEAGFVRFRPVLMTALAMVIGMLPMSLGLGEGGEQNAPLGRAVIGGLLFATFATLLFVPVVFAVIHGSFTQASAPPRRQAAPGT